MRSIQKWEKKAPARSLNRPMQLIPWKAICEMFAPFEGTCLYAIRADAFFHLSMARNAPVRFAIKNRLYPTWMWCRAARAQSAPEREVGSQPRYLFVCDYAAEPGFGTLRPSLKMLRNESLLLGLDRVIRGRAAEVQQMGIRSTNLDGKIFSLASGRIGELWREARKDFSRLIENCPNQYRSLLVRARSVLQTLLVRAYLFYELYEQVFTENESLRSVITHNDFTSCSYLACIAARNVGATSFVLQHGFPTQEYFPTSADYYLVWGSRFRSFMASQPGLHSHLIVAGAPRLDVLSGARSVP